MELEYLEYKENGLATDGQVLMIAAAQGGGGVIKAGMAHIALKPGEAAAVFPAAGERIEAPQSGVICALIRGVDETPGFGAQRGAIKFEDAGGFAARLIEAAAQPTRDGARRALHARALFEYCRAMAGAGENGAQPGNRYVRLAVQYILDNSARDIDANDIARAAGISPTHLYRLFYEATGMHPNEYLGKARVERAMSLLTGGSRPIGEIAELCGFASQQYFTRRFKLATGMTPREYRRSYSFSQHGSGDEATFYLLYARTGGVSFRAGRGEIALSARQYSLSAEGGEQPEGGMGGYVRLQLDADDALRDIPDRGAAIEALGEAAANGAALNDDDGFIEAAIGAYMRVRERYLRGAGEALRLMAAEMLLRAADAAGKLSRGEECVNAALRLIRSEYHTALSVDKLAAAAGVHPTYLHKMFKARTGETPMRYLQRWRLERAAELIDGGVSPREAARRSGFGSMRYFSALYKARFGLAPREALLRARRRAKDENKGR